MPTNIKSILQKAQLMTARSPHAPIHRRRMQLSFDANLKSAPLLVRGAQDTITPDTGWLEWLGRT